MNKDHHRRRFIAMRRMFSAPKASHAFLDQAKIYIKSGDGGPGAVSFRRENMSNMAAPDGGNGGKGGDIIFEAVRGLNTLIDFRYTQHFKAKRGTPRGARSHRRGRPRSGNPGADRHQVLDDDEDAQLMPTDQRGRDARLPARRATAGAERLVQTSNNRAPRQQRSGWPGEENGCGAAQAARRCRPRRAAQRGQIGPSSTASPTHRQRSAPMPLPPCARSSAWSATRAMSLSCRIPGLIEGCRRWRRGR